MIPNPILITLVHFSTSMLFSLHATFNLLLLTIPCPCVILSADEPGAHTIIARAWACLERRVVTAALLLPTSRRQPDQQSYRHSDYERRSRGRYDHNACH